MGLEESLVGKGVKQSFGSVFGLSWIGKVVQNGRYSQWDVRRGMFSALFVPVSLTFSVVFV